MNPIFEELDFQQTALGDISLRRRSEPVLNNDIVYEVKLGDEFLMSSMFVEAEEQLSTLALAELRANGFSQDFDIVVGGLGLGYTALTALNDPDVTHLKVIDVMQPVIDWHQQGLLPMGVSVANDPRCELVLGDFFALANDDSCGFENDTQVHAVLLDIDHSPSHWLNQGNQSFYSAESLRKLANKLLPNGVFAIWSNEGVDEVFMQRLQDSFTQVQNHLIEFSNPYTGGLSSNSVYVATKPK